MDTQSRYFKATRKALHACAAAAIVALSALSSPALYADDTDVFLGQADASDANVRPNILFILDTSGSMDTEDIADAPGKSRLDVMKTALVDLLNSVNNVNVGLMTFNSEGGPVRYPIGFIDAPSDLIEAGGFNVDQYVNQSSDDAEENVNTLIDPGLVKTNDPYLHITEGIGSANPTTVTVSMVADADDVSEDASSGAMTSTSGSLEAHLTKHLGFRFRSVAIPAGAAIISANLTLTVDPDSNNNSIGTDDEYSTADFNIMGEAANSSSSFASSNWTLTNRTKTLASQPWFNVPAAEANQTVTSPNLSLIIQEIVSRSGWASGNNLALFLYTTQGYRDFESCRDSCTKAPKLQITYTTDTTHIQKQVGMRFTNIRIPQGAQIRRAFLNFTAAATSSDATKFEIRGENVASSAAFTTTTSSISSRPVTGSSVGWTLSGSDTWLANQRYETPDIKDVIQELVNRSDWCGGQNMSLILVPASTNSTRLIKSFDGAGAYVDAPELRIEFDTDTQNISSPNTGCIVNDVTARISNSFDDAEERVSNNTTTTTSNSLELITDNGKTQYVGVRFRSLPIPQGTQILGARVEFTADGTSTGSDTLTIKGHKIGDSPAFAAGNGNKNISVRVATTASVTWTPADWNTDNQVISTPDISTIIQEIVNQGTWTSGNNLSLLISGSSTNTRHAAAFDGNAAQAARLVVTLKQNLAGVPSVSTQTVRERLIQEVSGLHTVGGTPTVNVFMEAMRYFRGMPAYWGRVRGGQSSGDRYGRVSHAATYQGGVLVQPSGCTNLDLNNYACVDEIVTNGPVYKSPIVDACQSNYIVLLSDGFQNTYYSGDGVNTLIQPAFPGTCNTANGGEDCGLKLAEFANRFDQRSDMEGNQTITTFTVGFKISTAMLQNMGIRGGGQYKTANSAAELVDAFQSFLGNILSRPTTFTAPTLTISAFNRLFNSNEIYISLFEPQRSASWTGNVKKYFLCTPDQANDPDRTNACSTGQLLDSLGNDAAENGQIVTSAVSAWDDIQDGPEIEVGGAGAQVPPYASRNVYSYLNPIKTNLADADNAVKDINTTYLTAGMLNAGSSAERTTLINWIRGQDVDDEDADGSTTDQRWTFGDPLHSAAVTVNYGIASGDVPITKLFVGTNDGGVRMINTATGQEEWIFIPQELLGIQKTLRDNPNGDHYYGMDGSPVAWINDNNGDSNIVATNSAATSDFVKIIIGQRRGGSNYYALNVTPPVGSPLTTNTPGGLTPTLMWKIDNSTTGYSRLGQTWSKPYVTSILVNQSGTTVRKNVVIFGGGYDPVNDDAFGTVNQLGNAIYIADAETGDRIWSASGTTGGGVMTVTDMKYSIPSDVRLIDMDGNGATDRLYVGDMGGQIWRVDLKGPITAGANTNIVVGKLAALSNTSTTTPVVADQRRFMFRPQVSLISDKEFANGTYVALAINSGNREDPLNEAVHDRMFVLRDYVLGPMTDTSPSDGQADAASFHTITYSGSDLVDVTDNVQTGDADALSAPSVYGWYINFKEASGFVGEKGITEGRILISSKPADPPVFTFNTYIPGLTEEASACSVTLGTNRTYFVNLLNGTGTDIISDVSHTRYKVNESYGIASDIIVIQQQGQNDVSVGGGTTDPTNTDLGDSLLPVYILEN